MAYVKGNLVFVLHNYAVHNDGVAALSMYLLVTFPIKVTHPDNGSDLWLDLP